MRKKVRRKWFALVIPNLIGLATFLIVALYTYYAAKQVNASEVANDAARKANRDNGRSLELTLNSMGAQTRSIERLAKATEDANKLSLVDNRPWIGTGATDAPRDNQGDLQGAGLVVLNGGRTPAVHVSMNLFFKLGEPLPDYGDPKAFPRVVECSNQRRNVSSTVLLPGVPLKKLMSLADFGIDQKQMNDVNAGRQGLYLLGCIDYSDASDKRKYRTYVTKKYVPANQYFSATESGNDAY